MATLTGVAIVFHCWASGELFARMGIVAEWVKLSPESRKQVRKYVQELEDAGYLEPIGKAGRATRYRLTMPERVRGPH